MHSLVKEHALLLKDRTSNKHLRSAGWLSSKSACCFFVIALISLFMLSEKNNLIAEKETQEEVHEILSSFDNANIEILSDIISGFRFASEHNIKTTNEQLQAFRQNMHWDLGFMLRVISLDFKSLEKASFSNKKALISEMEKLVSKYTQLSEMHNIEEY